MDSTIEVNNTDENQGAEYWANKGSESYNAKNYEEACKCYEKAIQLESIPSIQASFFNNWGIILFGLAKTKKDVWLRESACEKFEKAAQLDPNNTSVLYNWGIVLYNLAETKKDVPLYESACEKYEKAVQLDPNKTSAFYNWGFVLYQIAKIKKDEKFQKNLETFENASKKVDDPDTYLIKGELYFILGKTEVAKECFEKSKKSILEILTFLDKSNEREIIETEILYSLLDSRATEDGKFFTETIGSQSEEERKKYKKIYILSIFIISLLHVNEPEEKFVAHYLGKNVSQKLLFDSDFKFRLNAIDFSNDPSEGETLLDFLYEKGKRPSDERLINEEYEAFASCFVFDYDNLNMFRLYGKEQDEEGTGLSLVFRDSFFNEKAKMALGSSETDSSKSNDDNSAEKDKLALFRCIYFDPNPKTEQHIVTVGRKEEYLFYRDKIGTKFDDYNKFINGIVSSIRNEMGELKILANDGGINPSIVGQLLLNLRYLAKHVAFKEEQECRILKIHHLHDKAIKVTGDDYKQMYIEYPHTASMHIDKIYFGPKAKGFELFRSILKNKKLNIPCYKSENPLI